MKHLYDDGEGEVYAADSIEQAVGHVKELTGEPVDQVGWYQVPDAKTFNDQDGPMTAAAIAAEYAEPTQVYTTYN